MASSKRKMKAAATAESPATEPATPSLSRRAMRRKQTVIAHQHRQFSARQQTRRKELFEMKKRARIETRPQSNLSHLRAPSLRGHPGKHAAHRSGQIY